MKPFNLNEALAGKPVQLREGQKAIIKFVIPNPSDPYEVVGYTYSDNDTRELYYWTINGAFMDESKPHHMDIIGMLD